MSSISYTRNEGCHPHIARARHVANKMRFMIVSGRVTRANLERLATEAWDVLNSNIPWNLAAEIIGLLSELEKMADADDQMNAEAMFFAGWTMHNGIDRHWHSTPEASTDQDKPTKSANQVDTWQNSPLQANENIHPSGHRSIAQRLNESGFFDYQPVQPQSNDLPSNMNIYTSGDDRLLIELGNFSNVGFADQWDTFLAADGLMQCLCPALQRRFWHCLCRGRLYLYWCYPYWLWCDEDEEEEELRRRRRHQQSPELWYNHPSDTWSDDLFSGEDFDSTHWQSHAGSRHSNQRQGYTPAPAQTLDCDLRRRRRNILTERFGDEKPTTEEPT